MTVAYADEPNVWQPHNAADVVQALRDGGVPRHEIAAAFWVYHSRAGEIPVEVLLTCAPMPEPRPEGEPLPAGHLENHISEMLLAFGRTWVLRQKGDRSGLGRLFGWYGHGLRVSALTSVHYLGAGVSIATHNDLLHDRDICTECLYPSHGVFDHMDGCEATR